MLALLSNWKTNLFIAVVVALFGLLSLQYVQSKGLQSELDAMIAERATLKGNLLVERTLKDEALQAVGEWKESAVRFQKTTEQLRKVNREASAETRRLRQLFAEQDLGEIARREPGLVEARANSGTRDALRLLECATGSCTEP